MPPLPARPLRVLILPAWYPTPRYPMGGLFCQEQARALHAQPGVQVLVLFVDRVPWQTWRGGRGRLRREVGLAVYRVAVPRLPGVWPLLYTIAALLAVRRVVQRHDFRPDLVHAHVTLPAGMAGALIGRLTRWPLVLTEHSGPFARLMSNPLAARATSTALRAATAVVAVSHALRDQIWAYPALHRPITVIPNVVDGAAFARPQPATPSGAPPRLVFIGEMDTGIKGVPYLLEAVAHLHGQGQVVHLDLVGSGRQQAAYQAQAAQLGIAAHCTFHGLLPHPAVAHLLAGATTLVLPSLGETFGVVLVEALATGVPVVATRCGGPEEIVTPDVGVLVAPADPAALAVGIQAVLAHPTAYPAAHLRAVAAARYGPATVARQLLDLYRQLVPELR